MRNSSQDIKYFYPIKPNNQRYKTDVFCFIVYMALSLLVLSIFFYSFIKEEDKYLLSPRDPDGHRCGRQQLSQFPYIYFTEPTQSPQSLQKSACIQKCPLQSQNNPQNTNILKCSPNKQVQSCQQISQTYATQQNNFLMLCQPVSQKLNNIIQSKINSRFTFFQFQYIYEARFVIGILCPAICIAIMLFQLFLVYCTQNLKGLFTVSFVSFIAVSLFFAVRLLMLKQKDRFAGSTIIGAIAMGLSLLLIIYVLANCSKFKRSLNYLNICTSFIISNKRIIFLPLGMFFMWVISFSFAITAFIFIIAIGTSNQQQALSHQFPYQSNTTLAIPMFIIALVHYIWTCLILQHIGKYVAIVGASNWIMHTPRHFKNALFTMFKYHIGSVIAGSAFITLFSWIAEAFYFMVPNTGGRLCCCYFSGLARFYRSDCFTKFIGLHTEMTYLMIGLNGQSYSESGQQISSILVQNTKALGQTLKICKLIIKTCHLFVAFLTTLICYQFLIISRDGFNNFLTIFIILLISYLLASFGLDPYNQAYQSILLTVIINKTSKKKNVQNQSGIAQFSSAKSITEDCRISIYESIERWIQEQIYPKRQQTTQSRSPPNSNINK